MARVKEYFWNLLIALDQLGNAALAGTVQQGYAPVVGIRLPGRAIA